MAYTLLLVFLAVPVIEIALFIQVGGLIGLGPTLLAVLITAIAGTALVRAQGLKTLQTARAALDRGDSPAPQLFDGVCILFGGLLLLTPGFFTDAVGLLLLLPPVRGLLRGVAGRYVAIRTAGGAPGGARGAAGPFASNPFGGDPFRHRRPGEEEGRGSCRERVCKYVEVPGVAVTYKKKTKREQ